MSIGPFACFSPRTRVPELPSLNATLRSSPAPRRGRGRFVHALVLGISYAAGTNIRCQFSDTTFRGWAPVRAPFLQSTFAVASQKVPQTCEIRATALRLTRCAGGRSGVHEIQPFRRDCRASVSAFAMAATPADVAGISYLSQEQAIRVDEELFSTGGFSVDQLMELAGLSCACAIAEVYPVAGFPRVLVISGPGNNGGDGLVAARHLHHFGYAVGVCYPKPTPKPLYDGLVKQLRELSIPFVEAESLPPSLLTGPQYDILVDAVFGFSFKGTPRPPFDAVLSRLKRPTEATAGEAIRAVLVSVDIPSGWDVEAGDVEGTGLKPDMLISLTAPKLAARSFRGSHHFLGGRFVPPSIVSKYSLRLPAYPGSSQCVRIGGEVARESEDGAAAERLRAAGAVDVAALRKEYVGRELLEEQAADDPMEQFAVWFKEAVAEGVPEPNGMCLSTVDEGGNPSGRVVLLKGFDARGFVWYTNYTSRKGRELLGSGRAALTFWWETMNRQVRVEGAVSRVSDSESDEYFHSRPRGSQIGALASAQSSVVKDRGALEAAYSQVEALYSTGDTVVPRPDTWGGFRLAPERVEFWQGRKSRLHDRLLYTRSEQSQWIVQRLAP